MLANDQSNVPRRDEVNKLFNTANGLNKFQTYLRPHKSYIERGYLQKKLLLQATPFGGSGEYYPVIEYPYNLWCLPPTYAAAIGFDHGGIYAAMSWFYGVLAERYQTYAPNGWQLDETYGWLKWDGDWPTSYRMYGVDDFPISSIPNGGAGRGNITFYTAVEQAENIGDFYELLHAQISSLGVKPPWADTYAEGSGHLNIASSTIYDGPYVIPDATPVPSTPFYVWADTCDDNLTVYGSDRYWYPYTSPGFTSCGIEDAGLVACTPFQQEAVGISSWKANPVSQPAKPTDSTGSWEAYDMWEPAVEDTAYLNGYGAAAYGALQSQFVVQFGTWLVPEFIKNCPADTVINHAYLEIDLSNVIISVMSRSYTTEDKIDDNFVLYMDRTKSGSCTQHTAPNNVLILGRRYDSSNTAYDWVTLWRCPVESYSAGNAVIDIKGFCNHYLLGTYASFIDFAIIPSASDSLIEAQYNTNFLQSIFPSCTASHHRYTLGPRLHDYAYDAELSPYLSGWSGYTVAWDSITYGVLTFDVTYGASMANAADWRGAMGCVQGQDDQAVDTDVQALEDAVGASKWITKA